MSAKLAVVGVSIAALLGAAACTTTDPYSSRERLASPWGTAIIYPVTRLFGGQGC